MGNYKKGTKGICPECKMNISSLDYNLGEIKGEYAFYEYRCNFCGCSGKEKYRLVFIRHTTVDEKKLKK